MRIGVVVAIVLAPSLWHRGTSKHRAPRSLRGRAPNNWLAGGVKTPELRLARADFELSARWLFLAGETIFDPLLPQFPKTAPGDAGKIVEPPLSRLCCKRVKAVLP